MSAEILPYLIVGVRLVHLLGVAAAIGGSLAALVILRAARRPPESEAARTAQERLGLERAAATVIGRVEIVGAFVAIVGGIGLVVANPRVLDPAESGAGPWLFVKLGFVFAALALAHVRMFNLFRLVRLEEEPEDQETLLGQLRNQGARLDAAQVGTYACAMLVVLFRYVWFS